MSDLEPALEHNRKESDRLLRRKRQVLLIMVVCGAPVALLFPYEAIPTVVIVLLIVAGGTMGYFDLRRILVFRRDVRERRGVDDDMGKDG